LHGANPSASRPCVFTLSCTTTRAATVLTALCSALARVDRRTDKPTQRDSHAMPSRSSAGRSYCPPRQVGCIEDQPPATRVPAAGLDSSVTSS
jgi:hypothetical protein